MINIIKITLLLAFFILHGMGAAFAGDDHERAKRLKEAGDILPLQEVVEKTVREHPGRILEVELDEQDNKFIYKLEILDEKGILWKLKIDARTGELLKQKMER
ncbi:MAG: PepSY domain-containing protein [Nitrospirae bacterium]|nr:PepSY domain-containing protein [Nitrospirota bacterium]